MHARTTTKARTLGEDEIQAGNPVCITSTPNPANFCEKSQKWPKNERDFCIPGPFFAERPYPAS